MAIVRIKSLAEAQNHRCCYCHHHMITALDRKNSGKVPRNFLTKDHYRPRCYGGETTNENLIVACGQCNWMRGSLDAETFYKLICHWFRKDPTLHARWHDITKEEFVSFSHECQRIDRLKWQRQVKRCIGAFLLHTTVPMPFPPHMRRA